MDEVCDGSLDDEEEEILVDDLISEEEEELKRRLQNGLKSRETMSEEEYQTHVKYKEDLMFLRAKSVSNCLRSKLPVLVNDCTPELVFHLEETTVCCMTHTSCAQFNILIYFDPNLGKDPTVTTYLVNADGSCDLLTEFYSSQSKLIHERIMTCMSESEHLWPSVAKLDGFVISIARRTNQVGDSLLKIKYTVPTCKQDMALSFVSKWGSYLQNFFLSSRGKDCKVASLAFKVQYKCGSRKVLLFGKGQIIEIINDMKFVNEMNYISWSPICVKALSNTILKLAQLNDTWTTLQIGHLSAVPSLFIAKVCKSVLMLTDEKSDIGEYITQTAHMNNINNFNYKCGPMRKILHEALEREHVRDNICAVIFDSCCFGDFEDPRCPEMLMNNCNIKKIICVSCSREYCDIRKLVTLCCENKQKLEKSFVITRASSVDISPHGSNIQMVYLLERLTDVDKVIPNEDFLSSTDLPETVVISSDEECVSIICNTDETVVISSDEEGSPDCITVISNTDDVTVLENDSFESFHKSKDAVSNNRGNSPNLEIITRDIADNKDLLVKKSSASCKDSTITKNLVEKFTQPEIFEDIFSKTEDVPSFDDIKISFLNLLCKVNTPIYNYEKKDLSYKDKNGNKNDEPKTFVSSKLYKLLQVTQKWPISINHNSGGIRQHSNENSCKNLKQIVKKSRRKTVNKKSDKSFKASFQKVKKASLNTNGNVFLNVKKSRRKTVNKRSDKRFKASFQKVKKASLNTNGDKILNENTCSSEGFTSSNVNGDENNLCEVTFQSNLQLNFPDVKNENNNTDFQEHSKENVCFDLIGKFQLDTEQIKNDSNIGVNVNTQMSVLSVKHTTNLDKKSTIIHFSEDQNDLLNDDKNSTLSDNRSSNEDTDTSFIPQSGSTENLSKINDNLTVVTYNSQILNICVDRNNSLLKNINEIEKSDTDALISVKDFDSANSKLDIDEDLNLNTAIDTRPKEDSESDCNSGKDINIEERATDAHISVNDFDSANFKLDIDDDLNLNTVIDTRPEEDNESVCNSGKDIIIEERATDAHISVNDFDSANFKLDIDDDLNLNLNTAIDIRPEEDNESHCNSGKDIIFEERTQSFLQENNKNVDFSISDVGKVWNGNNNYGFKKNSISATENLDEDDSSAELLLKEHSDDYGKDFKIDINEDWKTSLNIGVNGNFEIDLQEKLKNSNEKEMKVGNHVEENPDRNIRSAGNINIEEYLRETQNIAVDKNTDINGKKTKKILSECVNTNIGTVTEFNCKKNLEFNTYKTTAHSENQGLEQNQKENSNKNNFQASVSCTKISVKNVRKTDKKKRREKRKLKEQVYNHLDNIQNNCCVKLKKINTENTSSKVKINSDKNKHQEKVIKLKAVSEIKINKSKQVNKSGIVNLKNTARAKVDKSKNTNRIIISEAKSKIKATKSKIVSETSCMESICTSVCERKTKNSEETVIRNSESIIQVVQSKTEGETELYLLQSNNENSVQSVSGCNIANEIYNDEIKAVISNTTNETKLMEDLNELETVTSKDINMSRIKIENSCDILSLISKNKMEAKKADILNNAVIVMSKGKSQPEQKTKDLGKRKAKGVSKFKIKNKNSTKKKTLKLENLIKMVADKLETPIIKLEDASQRIIKTNITGKNDLAKLRDASQYEGEKRDLNNEIISKSINMNLLKTENNNESENKDYVSSGNKDVSKDEIKKFDYKKRKLIKKVNKKSPNKTASKRSLARKDFTKEQCEKIIERISQNISQEQLNCENNYNLRSSDTDNVDVEEGEEEKCKERECNENNISESKCENKNHDTHANKEHVEHVSFEKSTNSESKLTGNHLKNPANVDINYVLPKGCLSDQNKEAVIVINPEVHVPESLVEHVENSGVQKLIEEVNRLKPSNSSNTVTQQSNMLFPLRHINDMVSIGGPRTDEEFRTQMIWKQKQELSEARAVSDQFRLVIPNLYRTRTPGLVFLLEAVELCSMDHDLSDRLEVRSEIYLQTKNVTMIPGILSSADHFIYIQKIRSDVTRAIYERMMQFIEESGESLFLPKGTRGCWMGFSIRVNSRGDSLIEVTAFLCGTEGDAVLTMSEIKEKLKAHFLCPEFINISLKSLIVKVLYLKGAETSVLLGEGYLTETIDDFTIRLYEPYYWSNPNGMKRLGEVILNLSKVDKATAVVQIECEFDIPSLYLAKECKELYLVCDGNITASRLIDNAKENGITNLSVHIGPVVTQLATVLNNNVISYKNVCMLIWNFCDSDGYDDVTLIRSNSNIRKIICISRLNDACFQKKIVALCAETSGFLHKTPFIIQKVVSVDMSYRENNLKTIFVLIRKPSKLSLVEGNKQFMEEKLNELLAGGNQENVCEKTDVTNSPTEKHNSPNKIIQNLQFMESDKMAHAVTESNNGTTGINLRINGKDKQMSKRQEKQDIVTTGAGKEKIALSSKKDRKDVEMKSNNGVKLKIVSSCKGRRKNITSGRSVTKNSLTAIEIEKNRDVVTSNDCQTNVIFNVKRSERDAKNNGDFHKKSAGTKNLRKTEVKSDDVRKGKIISSVVEAGKKIENSQRSTSKKKSEKDTRTKIYNESKRNEKSTGVISRGKNVSEVEKAKQKALVVRNKDVKKVDNIHDKRIRNINGDRSHARVVKNDSSARNGNDILLDVEKAASYVKKFHALSPEEELSRKWKSISTYAKSLSESIKSFLPNIVSYRSPGLVFCLEDLIPRSSRAKCDRFMFLSYVQSNAENVLQTGAILKYGVVDNSGTFFESKEIPQGTPKFIYEKITSCVQETENSLHHSVFWKKFSVAVNSAGKMFLHIEVVIPFPSQNFDEVLFDLEKRVMLYFVGDHCPRLDVESLIFSIYHGEKCETKVLHGMEYLTEHIGRYKVMLYEHCLSSFSQKTIGLSKAIVNMAKLDNTMEVIQLGCDFDAPTLFMANECKTLYLIRVNSTAVERLYTAASQKSIKNLIAYTKDKVNCLQDFLLNEMPKLENSSLCIFSYVFPCLDMREVKLLRVTWNVKKIIFVSKQYLDDKLKQKLVSLCQVCDDNEVNDPFILSTVIPVEVSVKDSKTLLLYLFVRKSLIEDVEVNKEFSVKDVETYLTSPVNEETKKENINKKKESSSNSEVKNVIIKKQCIEETHKTSNKSHTDQVSKVFAKIKKLKAPKYKGICEPAMNETMHTIMPEEESPCTQSVNSSTNTTFEDILKDFDNSSGSVKCGELPRLEDRLAVYLKENHHPVPPNVWNYLHKDPGARDARSHVLSYMAAGGPKTVQQSEILVKWKQICSLSDIVTVSDILTYTVPYKPEFHTSKLMFLLDKLRPCLIEETACDRLHGRTATNGAGGQINIVCGRVCSNGSFVPVKWICSNVTRLIYEKLVYVIHSSGYTLYDPNKKEGFWKEFIIRVNSLGQCLIHIDVIVPVYEQEAVNFVSYVGERLVTFLCQPERVPYSVVSLILTVSHSYGSETKILFGEKYLCDDFQGFNIKLYAPFTWSNPHGMEILCHTVEEMAHVDSSCAVVQMGCGYGLPSLYIAKKCKFFFLVYDSIVTSLRIAADAKKNGISKFCLYSNQPKHRSKLTQLFVKDLKEYENVSAIIFNFCNSRGEDNVSLLLKCPEIRTVVLVTNSITPVLLKNLTRLCTEQGNTYIPFMIVKVVSIEMCPEDNEIVSLFLLARINLLADFVEKNLNFSQYKANKLKSVKDKEDIFKVLADFPSKIVVQKDKKLISSGDNLSSSNVQSSGISNSSSKLQSHTILADEPDPTVKQNIYHNNLEVQCVAQQDKKLTDSNGTLSPKIQSAGISSSSSEPQTHTILATEPKPFVNEDIYHNNLKVQCVVQQDKKLTDSSDNISSKIESAGISSSSTETQTHTILATEPKPFVNEDIYHNNLKVQCVVQQDKKLTDSSDNISSKIESAGISSSSTETQTHTILATEPKPFVNENIYHNNLKVQCVVQQDKKLTDSCDNISSKIESAGISSSSTETQTHTILATEPKPFVNEDIYHNNLKVQCVVQQDKKLTDSSDNISSKIESGGISSSSIETQTHTILADESNPTVNEEIYDNNLEDQCPTEGTELKNEDKLLVLFEKIDTALLNGLPKTIEDYNNLVEWKYEYALLQATRFSKTLRFLLPTFVKIKTARMDFLMENFGLLFLMENLKPCPMAKTMCDTFQIYSGFNVNSGQVEMIFTSPQDGKVINVEHIRSDIVKDSYMKILDFIRGCSLELFDPRVCGRTGFWQSLTMKINHIGQMMLIIEGYVAGCKGEEATSDITCLVSKLKSYFKDTTAFHQKIESCVLKINYRDESEVINLYGENFMYCTVGAFIIKVYESPTYWTNPYGACQLSDAVLGLAGVNRMWGVLQLGSECDVPSFQLAMACKEMFVVDKLEVHGKRMISNANDNNIVNIQYFHSELLCNLLENNLKDFEYACIFVSSPDALKEYIDHKVENLLYESSNIKKIIFISNFNDLSDCKKLVTLCRKSTAVEPFVVAGAIPVDMCPYKNDVKMVYLLVRESLVSDHIETNANYSEYMFQNFLRLNEKDVNSIQLELLKLYSYSEKNKSNKADSSISTESQQHSTEPEERDDATLNSSRILYKKITNAIYSENMQNHEESKIVFQLKQEWVSLQSKFLSDNLHTILPTIVKHRTTDLIFYLENLKPCQTAGTLSDRFEVYTGIDPVTGEVELKYHLNPDGTFVPIKYVHSKIVQFILEKMDAFRYKYKYRWFNQKSISGLINSLTVTANEVGEIMVLVNVTSPTPRDTTITDELGRHLGEYFNLSESKFKLDSLALKVHWKNDAETFVLFGKGYLIYKAGMFNVCVHSDSYPLSNSYGVTNLSDAIVTSLNIGKKWRVLQMGCDCVLVSLNLAKICMKVLVMGKLEQEGVDTVESAKLNKTQNLEFVHGKDVLHVLQDTFKTNLHSFGSVCILIFDIDYFRDTALDQALFMRNNPNIKKIVYVSKFIDQLKVRQLFILCQKNACWNEPFVIVKIVPVDLSPYDNNVRAVFFLVRQSTLSTASEKNRKYSEDSVTNFIKKENLSDYQAKDKDLNTKKQNTNKEPITVRSSTPHRRKRTNKSRFNNTVSSTGPVSLFDVNITPLWNEWHDNRRNEIQNNSFRNRMLNEGYQHNSFASDFNTFHSNAQLPVYYNYDEQNFNAFTSDNYNIGQLQSSDVHMRFENYDFRNIMRLAQQYDERIVNFIPQYRGIYDNDDRKRLAREECSARYAAKRRRFL